MCSGTTSRGQQHEPQREQGEALDHTFVNRNRCMTAIVWFRRDLRVHDHPALRAALDAHDEVVPVFCLDDRLLHGRHASGPRTQFLLECLADLDRARGAAGRSCHGQPEEELAHAGRSEAGAKEVHFTARRLARSRAARGDASASRPRAASRIPGLNVVDDVGAM